jgi:hypothetical protein
MTMKVKVKPSSSGRKFMTLLWGEIKRSSAALEAATIARTEMQDGLNPKTGKGYRSLKPSTIENRKRLEKFNKTDVMYKAEKANNTFTGQLARAIRAVVIVSKRRLRVFVAGTIHRPYKTSKKGRAKNSGLTNSDLAQYLTDKGRDVLHPSKRIIKNFDRIISAAKKAAAAAFKRG